MALSHVTREEAVQRLTRSQAGAPDSIEALCDLVRAEVHARKHAPRAATLSRVARLLAPAIALDEQRLDEACDALEREGDVMLNPGGILYATPTRVVAIEKSARVFSSLPTRALAKALGSEVSAAAASRTIALVDGLTEAVAKVGGALVPPEAWAGLDRAPNADAAFLETLDQRLDWQALGAGSLEHDGALEWRAWQVTPEGARWRKSSHGQLWWARTRFGGHHRAWTATASPATSPFVTLSHDDADRARFALARKVASASALRIERSGQRVTLELPGWLPRPEYRWLALRATPLPAGQGIRWGIDADEEGPIRDLLAERLGVRCADTREASSVPPREVPTISSTKASRNPAGAPMMPSIDDRVPDQRALGPLLRTLRVSTYRDLLGVQLESVHEMRGVGRQKTKALERLLVEAKRRAAAAPASPSPVEGASTAIAAPCFNYDAWSPTSVFRRLPKRVTNILADNRIESIAALKAWHRSADRHQVDNYGPGTHALLRDLLRRLEQEGHEALVFGGPTPTSVAQLAQQFLEQLTPAARDIFTLRFIHNQTLEQIGQQKNVTRERIRQIIERELADAGPSWGPRGRELLDPALQMLEARGGIALTATVLKSLREPPLWALEFTTQLAGVELATDTPPGIATIFPREEFDRLRRDLRQQLAVTRGPLLARAVRDALTETGLTFPDSELPGISDAMFGITIDGDSAYPNRRSVQYLYLKVLREAGGPMSAEEVAQRVNEIDPSIAATKRNAVAHFQRAEHVFSHSHGKWIHENHLPLPPKELDDLTVRCLPEIEAAGGQAVSVRLLLDKLLDGGPALVTPHVLRDSLIATGKVRGWRAGTDVAWLGGDIARTSISEWIAEVAPELDQPFDKMELADAVSQRSGHLQGSILAQLAGAREAVVPVGRARYVSTQRVWPDEGAYAAALNHVKKAVLAGTLMSAEDSALLIPGLEDVIAKLGTGVVWGLASRIPDEILTRAQGWFAWPAAEGATLWTVVAHWFVADHPLFKARTLRDRLFDIGVRTEHVVHNLVAEWATAGSLLRVGMGWYLDGRASFERQVDLLDALPEVREMALGSQDFVRESPLREALNEVRFRRGSFRVPLG
jgi:hypothetical protein